MTRKNKESRLLVLLEHVRFALEIPNHYKGGYRVGFKARDHNPGILQPEEDRWMSR